MQWLQESFLSLTGESSNLSANPQKKGETLQRSGDLSKQQLLAFFKAGEELLRAEETRRKLKDARLLKQDTEDLVTELQKKLFERQGVEGAFGIESLAKVSTDFKHDNEVMAALLKFASLEEDALDEAEMPEADYEQKKRLMELAKAHAAQLMAKLDELPEDQKQAFLQDQMRKAEQLRQAAVGDAKLHTSQTPSWAEESNGAMSSDDQLRFFQGLHR